MAISQEGEAPVAPKGRRSSRTVRALAVPAARPAMRRPVPPGTSCFRALLCFSSHHPRAWPDADARFQSMHSDPRFARMPAKSRKVEIDDRFKAM